MMTHKIIYCSNQFIGILKRLLNSDHVSAWKSKGFSDESIKHPAASNNSLAPALNHILTKLQVKFGGSCLKLDKITFTHKALVNFYIVFEINSQPQYAGADFRSENSLFGAVKLIKSGGPDKYFYSGYGIAFKV